MGGSLNQPSRVRDEGPTGRRPLLRGDSVEVVTSCEGTPRIRTG